MSFKRKLLNIYHSFRILGVRRGWRNTKRMFFSPKPSPQLIETAKEIQKNWDKQFKDWDCK